MIVSCLLFFGKIKIWALAYFLNLLFVLRNGRVVESSETTVAFLKHGDRRGYLEMPYSLNLNLELRHCAWSQRSRRESF